METRTSLLCTEGRLRDVADMTEAKGMLEHVLKQPGQGCQMQVLVVMEPAGECCPRQYLINKGIQCLCLQMICKGDQTVQKNWEGCHQNT